MAERSRGDYVAGIDGGGTSTTLALADAEGREVLRRMGPPALVEPTDPSASAGVLIPLIREAAAEAGVTLPLAALCAGLAGAGTSAARGGVAEVLEEAGVARSLCIVGDGEVALEGALGGDAGVLLVAGTGSIAYGKSEDGRIERCGGWGMRVGDEGSGYALARAGLQAALQAVDGRGPSTRLLPDLLAALGLDAPNDIPARVAAATKGELAALAPRVIALAAAGDAVASAIVDSAATELTSHVAALLDRLAPRSAPVPVVFHGGVLREAELARRVETRLGELPVPVERRMALADAVTGAVRIAIERVGV